MASKKQWVLLRVSPDRLVQAETVSVNISSVGVVKLSGSKFCTKRILNPTNLECVCLNARHFPLWQNEQIQNRLVYKGDLCGEGFATLITDKDMSAQEFLELIQNICAFYSGILREASKAALEIKDTLHLN